MATDEEEGERVGAVAGVGVLGLDALASAAYGPEALLTVLLPLGAYGLMYLGPLIGAIIGLLAIVALSYRQTLQAYPNGGGAYTVAKHNLGPTASVLAAAALALDYILNVAVAISAGAGALVSAVPERRRLLGRFRNRSERGRRPRLDALHANLVKLRSGIDRRAPARARSVRTRRPRPR